MADLIIFIENKNYKHFTLPYLNIIKNMKIEFKIFSLEKLKIEGVSDNNIVVFKDRNALNKALINLQCKIFLTTTPGIGNTYFRKSKIYPKKNRPKYVYFFHSLVSPNENYIKNSFNGFDIIFSPNDLISEQIQFLVNTKKTEIITVGYQFLQKLSKNVNNNLKNILLAPSWGENNIFSPRFKQIFDELISKLTKNKHSVYLRPHPMDKENIEIIKDNTNIDFYLDTDINYEKFNYLITDWSGISLEYFYTTRNPVGFIDTPKKIRRKLSKAEKKIELIESEVRNKIGPVIDLHNLDLSSLFDFNYQKSEYIELLFHPEFKKDIVEYKLFKIMNEI